MHLNGISIWNPIFFVCNTIFLDKHYENIDLDKESKA